jgi:hypothetical protein
VEDDDTHQSEADATDLCLGDIYDGRQYTFCDATHLPIPASATFQPPNVLTGVKILGVTMFRDLTTWSKILIDLWNGEGEKK